MKITEKEIERLWKMIYNISLQMLHSPDDAEDAAQEIILRIIEKHDTFRGESKLETWAYRIARNHLIDFKRKHFRESISFEMFEADVTDFVPYDNELGLSEQEERIYIEQIKTGCTMAMLQCLAPDERFIFIIGAIFNFDGKTAAEICGISHSAYRKALSRSKGRITNFMNNNCGLVSENAFCKCRKRLLIATQRGRITTGPVHAAPEQLKISEYTDEMNEIDAIAQIYRDNPFIEEASRFRKQIEDAFKIFNA